MPTEGKKSKFLRIKALLESGFYGRMKDLETEYPTEIARALGMNHSRYIAKLNDPYTFTVSHIVRLAALLDVNPAALLQLMIRHPPAARRSRKKKKP